MSDEHIKEILIALINNGKIATGTDNQEIAENMALFINTLRRETATQSSDIPVITSN